jgi:hypothetical protein
MVRKEKKMREVRSTGIFNAWEESNFDVVFVGVNLPGSWLAWQMAAAGKKVAILCEGDFERTDHFRFTRIFPETLKELSGVGAQLGYATQLQQSAPHLFVQQRMVWLRGNTLTNQMVVQAFNHLAVRNPSEKAGTLKLSNYPEFSFFPEQGFAHGILCREYRYNHSRLTMEWLKAASRAGARVGNFIKTTDRKGRILQLDDRISQERKEIKAERVIQLEGDSRLFHFQVPWPDTAWNNPVRISGEVADYILFPGKECVQVAAFNKDGVNDDRPMINELKSLFSLGQNDILPVENRNPPFARLPVKPDLTIPDFPAEEMSERLSGLFPGLAAEKMPDLWFPGEPDRHISRIFELAQQKFYEAKQTGIDEAWFMELFYRYGPAIDAVTELAYEGMGETRDPAVLWEQALRRYGEEREWQVA